MAAPKSKSAVLAEANYKETIESILVAFILAFIFRAFVVEAFVIPTGSMAPTLYGAHTRYKCPDCGYTFDAGYKAEQSRKMATQAMTSISPPTIPRMPSIIAPIAAMKSRAKHMRSCSLRAIGSWC